MCVYSHLLEANENQYVAATIDPTHCDTFDRLSSARIALEVQESGHRQLILKQWKRDELRTPKFRERVGSAKDEFFELGPVRQSLEQIWAEYLERTK